MKILNITLHLFKRFALNNIKTFTMTPEETIQVIIGSNGSGKSSLVRMLTPLPADQNDFYVGGYKEIRILNNSNIYILTSSFNPVRHSFIKNDIELNPGYTVTVYRELVKQEFSITSEIQDLLIGEELFHSMTPARRREWFTKLSDTNYDYALSIYNKLRERNRDISGALKIAKKHFVTESAKLITEEEENKLKNDVEITLNELNLLIEQSAPLDRPVNEYALDKEAKFIELGNLSDKLLRMKCVAPYGTHPYGVNINKPIERDEWYQPIKQGFNSIEDIDEYIYNLSHDITKVETLLNNSVTEHSKITDMIDILVKTGEEGISSLHSKIRNLQIEKENILSLCKLGIEITDPINSFNALETISDSIIAIALAIPENSDKKFSSIKLNKLKEELLVYKNDRLIKISDIAKIDGKLKHLESHKNNGNISCPKCNHVWVPGYSEQVVVELIDILSTLDSELKQLESTIENIELEIIANTDYGVFYKDYMRYTFNWPILQPLWNHLNDNNYIVNSPRKIVSIIESFKIDLDYMISAKNIEDKLNETIELLKSAEQVGDANLNDLQNKLADYTTYIEEKTKVLSKLKNNLSNHMVYKKQLIESFELRDKIIKLLADVELVNINMIEMIRRETLNHCVRQLQSSLALKENTLHAAILQKGIIDDLKNQIDKMTTEEEASKLLIKKLSPIEGIIAEGMVGFIKHFVQQMNSIIKKIWSYPLLIQDCAVSSSELDYKFPLIVQTKDNIVPDIKYGSTAMREIVDIVFKLTAMKFLNLSDIPLMMDEMSASFDKTHRKAAGDLLKNLMETHSFSQLFLISHYDSVYGVFNNAEICVLDSSNILTPAVYNTHVIIE